MSTLKANLSPDIFIQSVVFVSMIIPASSRARTIGLLHFKQQCKSLDKRVCTHPFLFRASFCSQHNVNPEDDSVLDSSEILKRIEKHVPPIKVGKHGIEIVHDPLYNKGTGFNLVERDRLGLRGLVPPRLLCMDTQLKKVYELLHAESDPLRKSLFLSDLQNRNEALFFRLLIDHIEELAPLVYTPTVGQVCQKFGSMFRRTRGMYFSIEDRGQFGAMLHNWPCGDVQVIVVTDGSRILGLGDLGVNGMGIPIGKLALYTAAGGIDPRKVLPVMLDTGTNNESFLKDPYYFGMQHKRITGEDYWSFLDEFMTAVRYRWPQALVQFEDFSSDHAASVLNAYRLKQLCFNDDIQGTGATVLAGALSACARVDIPLKDQRIVILGAGSAGLGVATTLLQGMLREGLDADTARKRFYIVDKDGLIGNSRSTLASGQKYFARAGLPDQISLLEVVKHVKPTMLLGLSAAKGAFTQEVVREMAQHTRNPIIFPLSNPTSVAECTAKQAYEWTDGRCLFASGSPFDPVEYNGKTYAVSQCNNMFIFPGVGLASVISQSSRVSDRMLYSAARALANCMTPDEIQRGQVFPSVRNIRQVSLKVAVAVMQSAMDDEVALNCPKMRRGASLEEFIASKMYTPTYPTLLLMKIATMLCSKPLLNVNITHETFELEASAIDFLQHTTDTLLLVAVFASVKKRPEAITLIHNIANIFHPTESPPADWNAYNLSDLPSCDGVWLFVQDASAGPHIDRIGFLYSDIGVLAPRIEGQLLLVLSSVCNCVLAPIFGEGCNEQLEAFQGLCIQAVRCCEKAKADDTRLENTRTFPHNPSLLWIMGDGALNSIRKSVQITERKDVDGDAEIIQAFLSQSNTSDRVQHSLRELFPDWKGFTTSDVYGVKKQSKALKALIGSRDRQVLGDIRINGPFLCILLEYLVARREDVSLALNQDERKTLVNQCCNQVACASVKQYEELMSASSIFSKSLSTSQTPVNSYEAHTLQQMHKNAMRVGKTGIQNKIPRISAHYATCSKRFKELLSTIFTSICIENAKRSASTCIFLLSQLYGDLEAETGHALEELKNSIDPIHATANQQVQSFEYERFWHRYKLRFHQLLHAYDTVAQGPMKAKVLVTFLQARFCRHLLEVNEELNKISQQDRTHLEDKRNELIHQLDEERSNQMRLETQLKQLEYDIKVSLAEKAAHLHVQKTAVKSSLGKVECKFEIMSNQRVLLEEAAFIAIQIPAKKTHQVDEHQCRQEGYVVKQGRGRDLRNPLRRKAWKQRYFCLCDSTLSYAKTHDDHERGRLLGTICISGCQVEEAADNSDGFVIIRPSGVAPLPYRVDNNRTMTSKMQRNYNMRARSVEERDVWVRKLRQGAAWSECS
uniref:NADdependent malic enzyme putative n=1 Tax=Albugo laibachii Nc14 TaxID=890382 RepID=F0WUC6_9STRA|nr:NADdependent malic enzyme putative [Albugo laibachii Nc14]|eukprot:CCA25004.1 NADdependent malic enzyme putative [Albugo laibachii Nc14]